MKFYFLLILLFFSLILFSNNKLDSLNIEIKQCKEDSSFINLYIKKSTYFVDNNRIDSSDVYLRKALDIAVKIKDTVALAQIYSDLGVNSYNTSSYKGAIEHLWKASEIYQDLNDSSRLSDIYNNIGLVYMGIHEYEDAINYYTKSLQIKEILKQESNIALAQINLGVVQMYQGNDSLAKHYLLEPTHYFIDKINTKDSIEALRGLAFCYNNLGILHQNKEEFEDAERYLLLSLDFLKRIDNKLNISISYNNLAVNYLDISRLKSKEEKKLLYKKVEDALEQAMEISRDISDLKTLAFSYDVEVEYAVEINDYKMAYLSFVEFSKLNDSIYSIEKLKAIEDIEVKYETEKKQLELDKNSIELKKNSIELQKKDLLINLGVLSFIIVSFLIILLVIIYKKIKRSNKELHHKNVKINEINADMVDSLNLANYLQKAIIRGSRDGKNHFLNYFSFFQPKQIVGGDFVWSKVVKGKVIVAVADCVGHGVPGAMVSMLSVGLLNETINHNCELVPGEILNKVRKQIINNVIDKNKDLGLVGLDIALGIFDIRTKKLQFSGANLPVYIVSEGTKPDEIKDDCINVVSCPKNNKTLIEIKPNRMPIGNHIVMHDFVTHEIQLQTNDMLYMFTDGYADQFGGLAAKKYKYKPFKELLLCNSHKPMEEQKLALEKAFEEHKGSNEQVDDVTVVGIRI